LINNYTFESTYIMYYHIPIVLILSSFNKRECWISRG